MAGVAPLSPGGGREDRQVILALEVALLTIGNAIRPTTHFAVFQASGMVRKFAVRIAFHRTQLFCELQWGGK
jgi:hypothetical protein